MSVVVMAVALGGEARAGGRGVAERAVAAALEAAATEAAMGAATEAGLGATKAAAAWAVEDWEAAEAVVAMAEAMGAAVTVGMEF